MSPIYLTWTWPLFFGGVVSLALAYLGWRRAGAPGAVGFSVLMVGLAFWSIPEGLLLMSDDSFFQILWTKVEYIGIVSVPIAWWATAVAYTGLGKLLTRRRIAYISVIPFITLVLAWSHESHTLIYQEFYSFRDGGILHLNITYGPWWWINAAYSYLFLLWGAALFLMAASRTFYVYRSQAVAVLVGVSLPILGNLLYIFRIGFAGTLDLTPFTFAMAGLPIGWAIFRLRLFDLAPMARHAVMEGLRDGVVVLDPMNRIADLNPAALELLGRPGKALVGKSVVETLGVGFSAPSEELTEEKAHQDLHLDVWGEERVFELSISPLSSGEGDLAGRLLILRDVTDLRALGVELKTAKEKIQLLRELLPICAWCKQVRNDEGYWEELESYLTQNAQTQFTHGICPSCSATLERERREAGGEAL